MQACEGTTVILTSLQVSGDFPFYSLVNFQPSFQSGKLENQDKEFLSLMSEHKNLGCFFCSASGVH